jgi:hypothetical protein
MDPSAGLWKISVVGRRERRGDASSRVVKGGVEPPHSTTEWSVPAEEKTG